MENDDFPALCLIQGVRPHKYTGWSANCRHLRWFKSSTAWCGER